MSGKFVKQAVDGLHTTMSAGLQAQLTIVELAEGLSAGDLTPPVAYIKAEAPLDNTSPLIQIYATAGAHADAAEQRNSIMSVMCMVVLSYSSGVNLVAAEEFIMRYTWAMSEVIYNDPTLGGIGSAYLEAVSHAADEGDSSTTRHLSALTIRVDVHSP